jgi:hypothetical protein
MKTTEKEELCKLTESFHATLRTHSLWPQTTQDCPRFPAIDERHKSNNTSETNQIKDLARQNEDVQAVHELFDRGMEVPHVDVEYIDVGGPQLLETRFETEFHRLGVVPQEEFVLFHGCVTESPRKGILRQLF